MLKKAHIFIPVLIGLCIAGLVMKKLMIPLQGFFIILAFDSLAILFLFKTFWTDTDVNQPGVKRINFNLSYLVFAVCSMTVLYRLQYWNGWETLLRVAGILLLAITLLILRTFRLFFNVMSTSEKKKTFFSSYLPLLFFLFLIPFSVFTNPRIFHNFFNGTTWEQYVYDHYASDEAEELVFKYKPGDAKSELRAEELCETASHLELKAEYEEAFYFYNKAIDVNPANASCIFKRGLLKFTKLDISKDMAFSAMSDFNRVIKLRPDYAPAYFQRAVVHRYLFPKDLAGVKKDLLKAGAMDTLLLLNPFLVKTLAEPLPDSSLDTTVQEPDMDTLPQIEEKEE